MSPTISLLILPTSTISTISIVSSSVTRMPPTNVGSLPSRFMRAPICGPAAVHDDRVDADQVQEHHVQRERLLEVGVLHGGAAVLDDERLAAELPDVRQRLQQDLRPVNHRTGLSGVPCLPASLQDVPGEILSCA